MKGKDTSGRDIRPATDPKTRGWRERLALELLERALELIKWRSKPPTISVIALLTCGDRLREYEYLISCYEPRPRGRPRKRLKRKGIRRGAPEKWTPASQDFLLKLVAHGRSELDKKGATKVSDTLAFAEGVRLLWKEAGRAHSEYELRGFAEKYRRRIAEARKAHYVTPKITG